MNFEDWSVRFSHGKQNRGAKLHVLPSVVNDLLREVEQIFKHHGDSIAVIPHPNSLLVVYHMPYRIINVTDEALLALHSLFGRPIEKALELLETKCVVNLHAIGGRCVVQVTGSSGIPYTLFPGVNYCPCPAYRYQVISSQLFLTCKHVLAARLAEITHKGRNLSVSMEELTRILCAAANLDRY